MSNVRFVTLLSALAACSAPVNPSGGVGAGGEVTSGITPGVTETASADALLGRPVAVHASAAGPGAELRDYVGGTSLLVREGKVTLVRRPPRGDESFIQYWLHRYDSDKPNRHAVDEGGGGHGPKIEELIIASRGRTVHFETSSGRVVQVFEYAPIARKGKSP